MAVYSESFIPAEPWREDAACLDVDPDMFFPTRGDHQAAEQARDFCTARCSVTADCLEYALRTGQDIGIWGGTTSRQRSALRRKRKAA
jgi:WhiB family redox-sensing transcriptional regulator